MRNRITIPEESTHPPMNQDMRDTITMEVLMPIITG
jgi:hypothetical protein